jgi:hypothetical protein
MGEPPVAAEMKAIEAVVFPGVKEVIVGADAAVAGVTVTAADGRLSPAEVTAMSLIE